MFKCCSPASLSLECSQSGPYSHSEVFVSDVPTQCLKCQDGNWSWMLFTQFFWQTASTVDDIHEFWKCNLQAWSQRSTLGCLMILLVTMNFIFWTSLISFASKSADSSSRRGIVVPPIGVTIVFTQRNLILIQSLPSIPMYTTAVYVILEASQIPMSIKCSDWSVLNCE